MWKLQGLPGRPDVKCKMCNSELVSGDKQTDREGWGRWEECLQLWTQGAEAGGHMMDDTNKIQRTNIKKTQVT